MIKKISAVVALVGLMLAGVTPANASPTGSNSGAFNMTRHEVTKTRVTGSTNDRIFSVVVPTNTKKVTFASKFMISPQATTRLANVSGGTTMTANLTATGPDGQPVVMNNNMSTGLYASQMYQFMHGGQYTYEPTQLFSTAGSVSHAYMSMAIGNEYSDDTVIPAGTYTFTVSLKADGVEVTPQTYDMSSDTIGLTQADSTLLVYGQPTIAYEAGSTNRIIANVCVDKSLINVGDVVRARHYIGGAAKLSDTSSDWERRSNPVVGLGTFYTRPAQGPSPESTESYTVTAEDKTSGIKVKPSYWSQPVADGTTVQTYDISLFNETTGVEVSSSCAPSAPPKPVLQFSSRDYLNASVDTTGLPDGIYIRGQLFKSSDLQTVVATCTGYAPVASSSTSCYGNLGAPVDLATDYVLRARFETSADGNGAWSVFSDPAQLTGPPTPTSAPTIVGQGINSAAVTITTVPGATRYEIGIFTSTDLNNPVYTQICWGAPNCYVSGSNLFVGPDRYVAKYRATDDNQLSSDWSPASNEIAGYVSGTTLVNQPSGLLTAGKVRVSNPSFASILSSSSGNFSAGNDGRGGQLFATRSYSSANNETTYTLGRIKNDADELDTTIGGGSPITWSSQGQTWQFQAPKWFGTDKQSWIHVAMSGATAKVATGNLGSATVSTSLVNFSEFCVANAPGSMSAPSVDAISAPTERPVFLVDCYHEDDNGEYLATTLVAARLEANGSITNLGTLTETGANGYERSYTMMGSKPMYSVNANASGSQAAITLYVISLTKTNTPTSDPYDPPNSMVQSVSAKKLVRIPANADSASDLSKVDAGIADGTSNENLPETFLAPMNDGTSLYLFTTMYSGGSCTPGNPPVCTPPVITKKLYSTSSSTSGFGAAKAITGGGGNISFADGHQPNATSGGVTEVAVIVNQRNCMSNPCSDQTGLGRIIVSTGALTIGELVSTTTSGEPIEYIWLSSSGNLKRLITEPNATSHKILESKSLLGYTAAPVVPAVIPGITGVDILSSVDAGGGTVTITGTNLTLVTKIAFGGYEFAPTSKTATKITFKVPSKALAGGSATVPVAVRFGAGAGALMQTNRTFTYVGATKLAQAITLNVGADTYLPGAAPRNVTAISLSGGDPVMLPVTVVSKTATICTYVQGQLTFVGNGKCIIEATQAGDAGYAAATKVTKEIWVTPDYDSASTLYSTDAAKPSVTLTGTGLTSVTSVELVNPADPTEKITVTGSANIKANATGTQLTVKLPAAGVLAGDEADIKLVWGPNTTTPIATGDTFEFVGATKLNQVIDFDTVGLPATYGDEFRTLAPVSKDGSTVLDVVVALKSTTPTVCSVTGYDVRFLSNGACKIVASQAGNAGVNKAADVTMQFQVSKKAQSITIADSSLETTDAAEAISAGAEVDNEEMALEYVSGNEDVCTVDGAGFITGLQATNGETLRCVITVKQLGDNRYSAATDQTLEVIITSAADPADEAAAEGDGVLSPAPIANAGAKTFTATNDAGFELSWDKANGKLVPRATGVYTGFIQAKLSFTKNGVTYTCQVVFGSNAVMKNKTAKEKKAAKALKTFTTKNAFCADPNEIKPSLLAPTGGLSRANFAKIKPSAKDAKAAATVVGSKKYEAAALAQLKGFTGPVTIEIKRFRAWPTTGVNFTGDKSKTTGGKKIPVTTRTTRVVLG